MNSNHPFKKETQIIIDALSDSYATIEGIQNPEIIMLKGKILGDLRRHINALKVQLGQDAEVEYQGHVTRPLKKIMGKHVDPTAQHKNVDQTPLEVAQNEQQVKADEVYQKFLVSEPDQLIEAVDELTIRAVAKKVGLPVTETSPEKITTGYIIEIQNAIKNKMDAANNDENQPPLKPADTGNAADNEIIDAVNLLYGQFTSLEAGEITENTPDIVIRGVAKKAGLPVTETSPEKIDKKFIDQIKKAIAKKAEAEKAGK